MYVLARFIWNAEISVRVAIHCYERLGILVLHERLQHATLK